MLLDQRLLSLLACPCDEHSPLHPIELANAISGLACHTCGRVFEVCDGIPVLLLNTPTTDRGVPIISPDERP